MPKLLRVLLSIFAVLSLGVALAACGDDDDAADIEETADAGEEATDEATDEGEGEDEGGNPCAAGATAEEGEEEGPGGEDPSADATPIEIGVTENPPGADGIPTYAFTGGDALGTQGEYAVTINNTGAEAHMAFITRIDDSETRSLAEILALPPDQQDEIDSEDLADVFACPGQVGGPVAVNIDQPGRYALICFISVGSTADVAAWPDGTPHAMRGMAQEIVVS